MVGKKNPLNATPVLSMNRWHSFALPFSSWVFESLWPAANNYLFGWPLLLLHHWYNSSIQSHFPPFAHTVINPLRGKKKPAAILMFSLPLHKLVGICLDYFKSWSSFPSFNDLWKRQHQGCMEVLVTTLLQRSWAVYFLVFWNLRNGFPVFHPSRRKL